MPVTSLRGTVIAFDLIGFGFLVCCSLMERGEENGDNVATVDENLSALLEGMNSVCQVNPVLSGNNNNNNTASSAFSLVLCSSDNNNNNLPLTSS